MESEWESELERESEWELECEWDENHLTGTPVADLTAAVRITAPELRRFRGVVHQEDEP